MDEARYTRLLGEVASWIRHNIEFLASGWDDLVRPLVGDAVDPDDAILDNTSLFRILADLLDGNPYDSYSNLVRKLFINLTASGFGVSSILETRDLLLEYIVTALWGGFTIEDEKVDSAEYRTALEDFFHGEIGYLLMRDLVVVTESHITETAERGDALRRESELLLTISGQLHSALSERDVFHGILPLIAELIPSAQAGVILLYTSKEELLLTEVHNLDDFKAVKSEVELDESIYADILSHGEDRILDRSRISKSVDFIFRRATTVGEKVLRAPPLSVAVVPVFSGKKCIGGLALFNYSREGSFSDADIALLKVITNQLTLVLERVQYSGRAARQHERIKTVLEISDAIKRRYTPREAAETILEVVRKTIDFTRGIIYQVTSEGDTIPTGAIDVEVPFDVNQIETPALPEQLMVLALQRDQIIHIADISSEGAFSDVELPQPLSEVSKGSLIVAPLSIDEAPVGILLMYHREARSFDDEELEMINVICQQAAHFLSRAFEQEKYIKSRNIQDEENALAQRMQGSLAPNSFRKGKWDVQTSLIQAGVLGGDYSIIKPHGKGLMGTVGDVSGRGHPAGLIMMRTYGEVSEYFSRTQDPGKTLTEVNGVLCGQFEGSPKWFASHCFATSAIVSTEGRDKVRIAIAGTPPAILYRHITGDTFELGTHGIPLGIDSGTVYESEEIGFTAGDKLLLCTGGTVRAMDTSGHKFGITELNELFKRAGKYPSRVILNLIEGVFPEMTGGPLEDDRLIMILSLEDPGRKRLKFTGVESEREGACETAIRAVKRRTSNRDTLFATRLALHEIIKNAFEHGNQGDKLKAIEISYLLGDDFVHFTVKDSGTVFDPKLLTRETGAVGILKDRGRGFMMVKQLMERVWYDPASGEINLFIRLPSPEA